MQVLNVSLHRISPKFNFSPPSRCTISQFGHRPRMLLGTGTPIPVGPWSIIDLTTLTILIQVNDKYPQPTFPIEQGFKSVFRCIVPLGQDDGLRRSGNKVNSVDVLAGSSSARQCMASEVIMAARSTCCILSCT
ncbi:hypothetical protein N7495_008257 [Penicillium taxi]|uniref:uncharacterized protein n=1 Tax=Penicillium taxi TaxID=168475 RepID=UPI0025456032|nr:uncharacterized protein N7495_008257 [Penicillium taxi]KAJ5888216.1 hypothetical protein N7495_008257 [Penicillium taxi]